MSDLVKFQEFLAQLQKSIDETLNPEGSKQNIGFACFIFAKEEDEPGYAHMVTNSSGRKVLMVTKVFVERAKLKLRKLLRRKNVTSTELVS